MHSLLPKVGWVLLALSPCGCCILALLLKYAQVTHEPPKVIGVRKDAQGNVVQQIIMEASYRSIGSLPGPDRPISTRKYSFKYFLEEPGQPRRELTFLRDIRVLYDHHPLPVNNSPLWVSAGYDQEVRMGWDYHPLVVLVFDDAQVVHRRQLKDYSNSRPEFENGNRTYVFRSPEGLTAYDVTTDIVAPWKPAKN